MDSLVQRRQTSQEMMNLEEKKASLEVASADKGIKAILKTLVTDASEERRYIIAMNKYYNREANQMAPQRLYPGLLIQFHDLKPFRDNMYIMRAELEVVSPSVYVCIDSDTRDVDAEIETILEPFYKAGLEPDGESLTLYVYLNCLDIDVYTNFKEYIEFVYPDAVIISSEPVTDGFDSKIHVNVSMGDISKIKLSDFICNCSNKLQKFIEGNEDKTLFISETGARSQLYIPDIIALASVNGMVVRSTNRYAESYGMYLAKLWFEYDAQTKTFCEYVNDVFNAPTCLVVKGIVKYFCGIMETKVLVNVVDVETNTPVEKPFIIQKPSEIYSVESNLLEYLEKDTDNTWNRLFEYKGRVYRALSAETHFKTVGIDGVSGTQLNMTIKYAPNVSLLHEFYIPQFYNKLLSSVKGMRQTVVPKNFILYLVRRLRLTANSVASLGLNADDVDFWRPENINISTSLRELLTVIDLDTLTKSGHFDCRRGFLQSRVVVRMNELGVKLD